MNMNVVNVIISLNQLINMNVVSQLSIWPFVDGKKSMNFNGWMIERSLNLQRNLQFVVKIRKQGYVSTSGSASSMKMDYNQSIDRPHNVNGFRDMMERVANGAGSRIRNTRSGCETSISHKEKDMGFNRSQIDAEFEKLLEEDTFGDQFDFGFADEVEVSEVTGASDEQKEVMAET